MSGPLASMKRGGCKFGGSKTGAVFCPKRGAVVSQLVLKLKESYPPPPLPPGWGARFIFARKPIIWLWGTQTWEISALSYSKGPLRYTWGRTCGVITRALRWGQVSSGPWGITRGELQTAADPSLSPGKPKPGPVTKETPGRVRCTGMLRSRE